MWEGVAPLSRKVLMSKDQGQEPAVSIICPVYRAENYLARCIEGILSQTFNSFELLLVDDGSTDRSGEICDEYASRDRRIKVIHQSNAGVSAARQRGLDVSRGVYTIHVDPDDWVEPKMLEELYAAAVKEDADMVICDYYLDQEGSYKYQVQNPSGLETEAVLHDVYNYRLKGSCWNKLVRRSCYQRYGVKFPLDLSFCEDLYMNTELLKNPLKIRYLPLAFYHYVKESGLESITNVYNGKVSDYDLKLIKKFSKLLEGTSVYEIGMARIFGMVVPKAFQANIYSSAEFKRRFYPYRRHGLYRRKGAPTHWMYYFACCGFYRSSYFLYKIWQFVKKRIFFCRYH